MSRRTSLSKTEAEKVDDEVSLHLTDDIYDLGMLAFDLLDNVDLSPDGLRRLPSTPCIS